MHKLLVAGALAVFGVIGVAGAAASDGDGGPYQAPEVGIGTALSVARVECGWALDDLPEAVQVTPGLVDRCDYRATHKPCQEDEICALAQVRDTGNYVGQ